MPTERGANLKNGCLCGIHCENTNLNGADLSNSDITEAGFYQATLIGTNLSNTKLHQTGFTNSDLTGANLSGAIMDETWFDGSNLSNANLMGVQPEPSLMVQRIRLMGKGFEEAILCKTIMPDGSIRNDNCMPEQSNELI